MDRHAIHKIPGNLMGAKDVNGDIVIIDHLLENSKIEFDKGAFGIYLPSDEILKRQKYGWFVRSNKVQILSSNTNVGKLFALSYNQ